MLSNTVGKKKTAPQVQATATQETLEATPSTDLGKLDHPGVHYGPEHHDQELVNWEEIFRLHVEETKRLDREKDSLIETAQKKETSWELLRECTRYLKENEKNWKLEEDKNSKIAKN